MTNIVFEIGAAEGRHRRQAFGHGVHGHQSAVGVIPLNSAAFIQRRPVAARCIDGGAVRPAAIGVGGLDLDEHPAVHGIARVRVVVISIDDEARRVRAIERTPVYTCVTVTLRTRATSAGFNRGAGSSSSMGALASFGSGIVRLPRPAPIVPAPRGRDRCPPGEPADERRDVGLRRLRRPAIDARVVTGIVLVAVSVVGGLRIDPRTGAGHRGSSWRRPTSMPATC